MASLKEHCETYKWLPMNRYGYLVIRPLQRLTIPAKSKDPLGTIPSKIYAGLVGKHLAKKLEVTRSINGQIKKNKSIPWISNLYME